MLWGVQPWWIYVRLSSKTWKKQVAEIYDLKYHLQTSEWNLATLHNKTPKPRDVFFKAVLFYSLSRCILAQIDCLFQTLTAQPYMVYACRLDFAGVKYDPLWSEDSLVGQVNSPNPERKSFFHSKVLQTLTPSAPLKNYQKPNKNLQKPIINHNKSPCSPSFRQISPIHQAGHVLATTHLAEARLLCASWTEPQPWAAMLVPGCYPSSVAMEVTRLPSWLIMGFFGSWQW